MLENHINKQHSLKIPHRKELPKSLAVKTEISYITYVRYTNHHLELRITNFFLPFHVHGEEGDEPQ
jgi:hypothetical protein